jgi:hypothetical protein
MVAYQGQTGKKLRQGQNGTCISFPNSPFMGYENYWEFNRKVFLLHNLTDGVWKLPKHQLLPCCRVDKTGLMGTACRPLPILHGGSKKEQSGMGSKAKRSEDSEAQRAHPAYPPYRWLVY